MDALSGIIGSVFSRITNQGIAVALVVVLAACGLGALLWPSLAKHNTPPKD